MTLLLSRLGGAFDRSRAYVYLLVSRLHGVVYVGETNDVGGSLGRIGSHVRPGGTFDQRFEEAVGLPCEEATDLVLVSAPLPLTPEYTGVEKSYRQGVEYLVQTRLHGVRGALGFSLIARVAYSSRSEDPSVERLADEIVTAFVAIYPGLA